MKRSFATLGIATALVLFIGASAHPGHADTIGATPLATSLDQACGIILCGDGPDVCTQDPPPPPPPPSPPVAILGERG